MHGHIGLGLIAPDCDVTDGQVVIINGQIDIQKTFHGILISFLLVLARVFVIFAVMEEDFFIQGFNSSFGRSFNDLGEHCTNKLLVFRAGVVVIIIVIVTAPDDRTHR